MPISRPDFTPPCNLSGPVLVAIHVQTAWVVPIPVTPLLASVWSIQAWPLAAPWPTRLLILSGVRVIWANRVV